jgi:phenylpyruvate tautomerase PptA (4-oxalocrotonate tautomerase family)
MPVFHFHVPRGFSVERKHRIADAANQSLVDALGIPPGDRFITITELGPGELHIHPTFMDMQRSHEAVMVDILLGAHRPLEQKKTLFATLSALLHKNADIRPDDLFIAVIPVPNENFSFGRGIAQLADMSPKW